MTGSKIPESEQHEEKADGKQCVHLFSRNLTLTRFYDHDLKQCIF